MHLICKHLLYNRRVFGQSGVIIKLNMICMDADGSRLFAASICIHSVVSLVMRLL